MLDEFRELAASAGARIAGTVRYPDRTPDPKFSPVPARPTRSAPRSSRAAPRSSLFDQPLSPAQERNLEHHTECRVLDRRALILDIFAQRANTFEGKLQVELAQLRAPVHPARERMDASGAPERRDRLRGPGETQLETDRRLVDKRIRVVRERLEHVRMRRRLSRRARSRSGVPVVRLGGLHERRGSRPCSIGSPELVSSPKIDCSPPLTRRCAASNSEAEMR